MRRSGFTLIEVSFTVLLTALIALAVFGMLSAGIDLWGIIQRSQPEEDVAILFDKMGDELKNAFEFHGIPFEANGTFFSFPTMIRVRRGNETTAAIGVVQYIFRPSEHEVQRSQRSYGEFSRKASVSPRPVLKEAGDFAVTFYFFDETKKEYAWSQEWPPRGMFFIGDGDFPLAVRISLELNGGNATRAYEKTVFFPCSG